MTDDPKRSPRFWPLLFVTAFLLGAILWAFWMTKFVIETRARRVSPTNDFFVPMATNSPAATNRAPH
jgi:hypothetical protein